MYARLPAFLRFKDDVLKKKVFIGKLMHVVIFMLMVLQCSLVIIPSKSVLAGDDTVSVTQTPWGILTDDKDSINDDFNMLEEAPGILRTFALWACIISLTMSFAGLAFFSSPQRRDEAKENIVFKLCLIVVIAGMVGILDIIKLAIDHAVGF